MIEGALFFNSKPVGVFTVNPDGIFTYISAAANITDKRILRAYLCEGEKYILIGVMEPDRRGLYCERKISSGSLAEAGIVCSETLRGEVIPDEADINDYLAAKYSDTDYGWKVCENPYEFVDKLSFYGFNDVIMIKRENDKTLLAARLTHNAPYGLMPAFAVSTPINIDGCLFGIVQATDSKDLTYYD